MSSALSGVLAGVERGVGLGLNIYQTMEDRSRQKRLDRLQEDRYARQDMESDRKFESEQQRFRVADDQWERNFTRLGEQFDKQHEVARGQLKVQERQAAVSEGQLGLANKQFDYRTSEDRRVRDEANAESLFRASLLDDDGNYITDNRVYAERMNNNPEALMAMLRTAAARGLIDPARIKGYTGAQLVPTENGLVLRVAGVDGTGQAIRAGGAPLTAEGTSDPNDPAIEVNLNQLRMMSDPAFREASRSSALARDQIAGYEQTSLAREAAITDSFDHTIGAAQADVAETQAKLDELMAKREQMPARIESSNSMLPGRANTPNPELRRVDREIAALSKLLEGKGQNLTGLQRQAERVPERLSADRAAYAGKVTAQHSMEGENYRQNTVNDRTQARAELPGRQAQADKKYEGILNTVANDLQAKASSKGVPLNNFRMDRNQILTLGSQLPVEVQRRVADDPQARAAFYRAMRVAAETGFNGNPAFLMEADAAGADLQAYAAAVMDPGNAQYDDDTVHQMALEAAKEKAASPARNLGSILGSQIINR